MQYWQILIIIVAAVVFFYLATSLITCFLMNYKLFSVRGRDPNNNCFPKFDDFDTLNREEYTTTFLRAPIRGYIYTNKNYQDDYKGFIILSHGLWGTHIQYLLDIEFLTSLGYKVLAFDNYGVGISGGSSQISLANASFVLDTVINDVEINNINDNLDIHLYGHSMGGYAISYVLKKHHEIKKAIIRSSPISASKAGADLLIKEKRFLGTLIYPTVSFSTNAILGRKNNPNAIKSIKKNNDTSILLLHAKNDSIVPFKHSVALYFLKKKKDNVETFITDYGKHNSIVKECCFDTYTKLKEHYKLLLKTGTEQDLNEFALYLKENKRKLYFLDEDITSKIKEFLNSADN